ncbi:hypothetical protein [Oceanibacterium hippocampi]|uniref:Uncharacterized protein n=1 Tax=Oceanibacterium hippocampi TaxID=745714 RepID=A0A1Y5RAS0_9PROT|nr:hypothetical protein [Oceanibacterium hippocampi]SLN12359.1 hypothetical protein OCH7691_00150 [Oceanibacterium hippocampi]
MLDVDQFRSSVVVPVLTALGLNSPAAQNLLLGTAAVESRFRYLRQLNGGPALGLYQMEPTTERDIWDRFLAYRSRLRSMVRGFLVGEGPSPERHLQLIWNLAYATAMCRVHYFRVAEPLPAADDAEALGHYWKLHYNTRAGAGDVGGFVSAYRRLVRGRKPSGNADP